ncbi:helix-turn-helix domain-containing protein, partial [Vibrio fluvialis]|nr:helix-turn-helix domain-containing protein [Vibrio fluvialis]
HIEAMTLELFLALLARQSFARKIDPRIQKAVQTMRDNLARSLTINELANIACLSTTQYKNLFKANLGMTTFQYLTQLRMERARALLTHSDYPIGLIAEQVGFQDPSAFSRSFSRYFGQPPKFYAK